MELSFQEILLLNYHWRLSVWGYLGKIICCMGFPSGPLVKNPPANSGGTRDLVGKIPWSRKWLPTPVFLPGKSHGQRSLAGHCPWGWNESDMTEHACTAICYILYKSGREDSDMNCVFFQLSNLATSKTVGYN